MNNLPDITFIGFGEAASAFAQGWQSQQLKIAIKAYDIKTENNLFRPTKLNEYEQQNIHGCINAKTAVAKTNVIFSLVTADRAAEAAKNVATTIGKGQYYFDCNSCAPATKIKNAETINGAGGKYVDVAIMAPVHPLLHRVPILICGDHALEAQNIFSQLSMSAEIVEGQIGQASSIKMVRSIMVKGLEALNAECLLSARKLGISDSIIQSLDKSYPEFDWRKSSGYMLERMTEHGIRRAAEMREVALTVEQIGLKNPMSKATIEWQQTIGDLELKVETKQFEELADMILKKL